VALEELPGNRRGVDLQRGNPETSIATVGACRGTQHSWRNRGNGDVSQGARRSRRRNAWAAPAGPDSSWLDLVDGMGHNLDENTINQRALVEFMELATANR
jgi:hypothetical protein